MPIPDADRIGEIGQGWQVSTATLMNERVAIGGGADQGIVVTAAGQQPASVPGHTDHLAFDEGSNNGVGLRVTQRHLTASYGVLTRRNDFENAGQALLHQRHEEVRHGQAFPTYLRHGDPVPNVEGAVERGQRHDGR